MSKQNSTYLAHLETQALAQAYRIGELEAALLYVLNIMEHHHNPDMVYINATRILLNDFSYSNETGAKYKELTDGR